MYCPKRKAKEWNTLIDHIEELAIENHSAALSLNKRFNKAYTFTRKGFESLKGWILKLTRLFDGGL
jgi:hypothetical protein